MLYSPRKVNFDGIGGVNGIPKRYCRPPLPTITLNKKHISNKKATIIFFLGVAVIAVLIFIAGAGIAHSVGKIETRYDPETLRYKTK